MNATDNHAFGGREVMLRDHTATSDVYSKLVEVRFKLLTFVPTVTTIAVGLVTLDKTRTGNTGSPSPGSPSPGSPSLFGAANLLVIGLIGLVATLALVIYEVRNSQIHDRAIHRLKHLEIVLGFTPSYRGDRPRGVFGERGRGAALLGVVGVKHDRALAMIYGIVTAAWTTLALFGAAEMIDLPGTGWPRWIWIPAAIAGLAIAIEIGRLSGRDREPELIYMLDPVFREAEPTSKGNPADGPPALPIDDADPTSKGNLADGAAAVLKKLDIAHRLARTKRSLSIFELAEQLKTDTKHPDRQRGLAAAVLKKLNKAHRLARTKRSLSIFKLAEQLKMGTKYPNKKPGKNAVLDLAYAVGVIKDRQSWLFWWWYGGSGEKRKQARGKCLIAKAETISNYVDALREGIVGADDVHAVLAEYGWPTPAGHGVMPLIDRHRVMRLTERESVKRINRRYGDGAPWASSQEVKFRIELLLAAHERDKRDNPMDQDSPVEKRDEPMEEHRV
jgi:hypothetical protein